jgi:hypothetical protein
MKKFTQTTDEVTQVFKLKPNKSFVEDVNVLLHKFRRENDRDIFMKEFFGKIYGSWKEYFHPCKENEVVFSMLVNMP